MKEAEPLPAPPAGEDIHMPGPTLLPILNAVGLTVAILGVTLSWIFSVAGGLLFVLTAIKWIADVRRDISELPLGHGEPH